MHLLLKLLFLIAERSLEQEPPQGLPSPEVSSASKSTSSRHDSAQRDSSLQFAPRSPQPALRQESQASRGAPPPAATMRASPPAFSAEPRTDRRVPEPFSKQEAAEAYPQEEARQVAAPKAAEPQVLARDSPQAGSQVGNGVNAATMTPPQTNGGDAQILETYTRELRAVAALEVKLFNAS